MNTYLLIAAALTVSLALAHSVLGEIKIFRYLKDDGVPVLRGIPLLWKISSPTTRTLRFVWHIASILGLGLAAILVYFSSLVALSAGDLLILKIIAVTMFLAGLLTLIFTKGAHLGWIVFWLIAGFTLLPAI